MKKPSYHSRRYFPNSSSSTVDKYNRKEYERDYKKLVKQLHKLNDKFKKFTDDNDPDRIERNLLKSRGKDVLSEIKDIEIILKIDEADRIAANKYFI